MKSIYSIGKYVLFFLIYSLLGVVVETIYRLITEQQLYGAHGFLHLPLFPIYGFGALLIILLLRTHVRHPIWLFFAGAFLATVLEFVGHWLIEVVFGDRIWDYKSLPFNLDGRISLYSSVGFGLGAVLLVHVIHPRLEKLVNRLPKRPTIIIASVVLTVLVTDFVLTVIERLGS
ncbi:MAG: putative ABC transporter permease [Candidatus Microsaccharimonas sp.]